MGYRCQMFDFFIAFMYNGLNFRNIGQRLNLCSGK